MAEQQWLLLPGLCRESRHWGKFPKLMTKNLTGCTINCIDLPGNGRFYKQTCPTSVTELINELHTKYRSDQPIYLMGLSMGGMIAYHWMQLYPDDLRGIVMINSSLAPLNPWYQRIRPSALPGLLRAVHKDGYERERTIFDLTCNNPQYREETLAFWQIYQLEKPVSYSNFRHQLQLSRNCRADAYPPKKPVLLLSSAGDKLVDPCCSEQLAIQWKMPHFQNPEAGHDLPHDQPEWLLRQINSWLND